MTKDNEYGPVNLALCRAEEEEVPWLFCTNQKASYATIRTYSRRMWIEQLFADLEDGGFHPNRSRIYSPGATLPAGDGSLMDVRLASARWGLDGQAGLPVESRPD